MKRILPTLMMVLACAAVLAPSEVNAQARGSSPSASKRPDRKVEEVVDSAATRARKLAELDAWLRRLVGRFRVTGTVEQSTVSYGFVSVGVQGAVDCLGMGEGPGVNCVLNITWGAIMDTPNAVGRTEHYNTMRPAVMLLGFDPDTLEIHFLLADDHSIAESGLGPLTGDTVAFRERVVKPSGRYETPCRGYHNCRERVQIVAPEGKVIRIEFALKGWAARFTFLLHRLPEGKADAASKAQ